MTSKIEWLRDPTTYKAGYTINPVKGVCPMGCPYCYARRMYARYKWNPEISWHPEVFDQHGIKQPSKIFIGSTIELFGDWVNPEWMLFIMNEIRTLSQHTFIFLTKKPENLARWSPFPPNVWVGVSVTNQQQYDNALKYLKMVDAKVKFLSCEPLLEHITLD